MKKIYSGFTLIELLVVVLIIGILAAVAVPQYMVAVQKSKAAEAFANIKALRNAIDIYYLETGTYTTDMTQLDVDVKDSKYFYYAINIDGPRAINGSNDLNTANFWIHYIRKDYSDANIAGKIICDAKQGYERYCLSLNGAYYGNTGFSAKRYILKN
jgi:type IV pilus assembly protein PilE